jgi:hypothetical protein
VALPFQNLTFLCLVHRKVETFGWLNWVRLRFWFRWEFLDKRLWVEHLTWWVFGCSWYSRWLCFCGFWFWVWTWGSTLWKTLSVTLLLSSSEVGIRRLVGSVRSRMRFWGAWYSSVSIRICWFKGRRTKCLVFLYLFLVSLKLKGFSQCPKGFRRLCLLQGRASCFQLWKGRIVRVFNKTTCLQSEKTSIPCKSRPFSFMSWKLTQQYQAISDWTQCSNLWTQVPLRPVFQQ